MYNTSTLLGFVNTLKIQDIVSDIKEYLTWNFLCKKSALFLNPLMVGNPESSAFIHHYNKDNNNINIQISPALSLPSIWPWEVQFLRISHLKSFPRACQGAYKHTHKYP